MQSLKKNSLTFLAMIAFSCLLGGCVSFFSEEVVERSRQTRPSWATEKQIQGKFAEFEQAFVTVLSQDGLLNFLIGAKETQTKSLDLSARLLVDFVAERLKNLAQQKSIVLQDPEALRPEIAQRTEELHGIYSAVSDLYFEKKRVRGDEGIKEVYFVQVRIDFSRQGMNQLEQKLAQDLKKSRQDDLRALSEALSSQQLSH